MIFVHRFTTLGIPTTSAYDESSAGANSLLDVALQLSPQWVTKDYARKANTPGVYQGTLRQR